MTAVVALLVGATVVAVVVALVNGRSTQQRDLDAYARGRDALTRVNDSRDHFEGA